MRLKVGVTTWNICGHVELLCVEALTPERRSSWWIGEGIPPIPSQTLKAAPHELERCFPPVSVQSQRPVAKISDTDNCRTAV